MKKQARERMQVGGGATADGGDAELFSLNKIKSKKVIQTPINSGVVKITLGRRYCPLHRHVSQANP